MTAGAVLADQAAPRGAVPVPPAAPAALLPDTPELLGAILAELRTLNGNLARLEDDLRAALPFRFRPGRRG